MKLVPGSLADRSFAGNWQSIALVLAALAWEGCGVGDVRGDEPRAAGTVRFEFTRMIAHWDAYGDPAYLPFVEEARPEVAQLGFYGAHFYSIAHTPAYGGYPAHFPVRGIGPCGDWFAEKNSQLHKLGVKVVGHFNVEFLVGDMDGPEGPRGFFKFYRDLWDERELGSKPVADPLDFLEKNADGSPIGQKGYGIGGMHEYWACLRNPNWQKVLKAWVKRGVERGIDGYMVNYFYRHNCLCEHCQSAFREYLGQRYSAAELRGQFGIESLGNHRFSEIVSWHDPRESTPLRREMLRFSQVSNKQVFDEVFVKYGKSIKPGLIVGQWNHLGNFSQISGDERCLLPGEMWGRDEDYLWYSTGDSAHFTDLEKRFLGDATLQARYIRGAFDDKPFTLGKYEGTRIRAAIAELAANGGAPMGFYTRFTDPAAREVIARYYRFLARHDALYRGQRPRSEEVLLFPRKAVHEGRLDALERFRQVGLEMLEGHRLFDVLPDDVATAERLASYRRVVSVEKMGDQPESTVVSGGSRFEAPVTTRVSSTEPAGGGEWTLHLVNYNRVEPPKSASGQPSSGGGIKDEQPIAESRVVCDVVLPEGRKPARVRFRTPESDEVREIEYRWESNRVKFKVPEFFVYGVVSIEYAK